MVKRSKLRRNDVLLPFRSELREDAVEALISSSGVNAKTAAKILEAYPDGRGLEAATENAFIGMGASPSQAKRIRAAFRLVRVCDVSCERKLEDKEIRGPGEVCEILRRAIGHMDREYFAVVLLDARQKVVDVLGVSVGGLASVEVHPREVFREAIRRSAHAIIVAHNHPSGSSEPSQADIDLTRRLKDVSETVGIQLLDHVIITKKSCTSLATMGLLRNPTTRHHDVEKMLNPCAHRGLSGMA